MLLIKLLSEAESSSATFQHIEADDNLCPMLFHLLYLPDYRERKYAQIAILNMYQSHPSKHKRIVHLLEVKYQEMVDYTEHYSFLYHEITAMHRDLWLLTEDDDERLLSSLRAIYVNYAVKLLGVSDLGCFLDQWTFLTIEIGPFIPDLFDIIMRHAFTIETTGWSNYYRDSNTFTLLQTLMTRFEPECGVLTELVKWILENARTMTIRPSLHEELILQLFDEDGYIYKCLNGDDGLHMFSFECYAIAILEINCGLRELYAAIVDIDLYLHLLCISSHDFKIH